MVDKWSRKSPKHFDIMFINISYFWELQTWSIKRFHGLHGMFKLSVGLKYLSFATEMSRTEMSGHEINKEETKVIYNLPGGVMLSVSLFRLRSLTFESLKLPWSSVQKSFTCFCKLPGTFYIFLHDACNILYARKLDYSRELLQIFSCTLLNLNAADIFQFSQNFPCRM